MKHIPRYIFFNSIIVWKPFMNKGLLSITSKPAAVKILPKFIGDQE